MTGPVNVSVLLVSLGSAGLSLLHVHVLVDATCLMILGGTNKQINTWTSKPLIPSRCDYQEQCIMESSEISPIAWIHWDGLCNWWLHQFCAGLTTVHAKQFICRVLWLINLQKESVSRNKYCRKFEWISFIYTAFQSILTKVAVN